MLGAKSCVICTSKVGTPLCSSGYFVMCGDLRGITLHLSLPFMFVDVLQSWDAQLRRKHAAGDKGGPEEAGETLPVRGARQEDVQRAEVPEAYET